jgi:hypothetical protein
MRPSKTWCGRGVTRLAAGGKWIRTLGPSRLILGEEKGRRSIRVVAKDAVPSHGGTSGSNPCTLQSGYWLVGIVDWPNRAGLPGVARESCVLST